MDKKLTTNQLNHLQKLKKNLDAKRSEASKHLNKLEEVLSKGLTQHDLLKANYNTASIELFHGIDSYDLFCEVLHFHQDYNDEWDFTKIFDEWFDVLNTGFDTEANDEKSRLYSWVRSSIIWEKQEEIFFVWLTTLWHQKEFYRYPINAFTLQNNSVERFDLNRVAWFEHLTAEEQDSVDQRYTHIYDRPLSTYEMAQRVRLKHLPKFKSYSRVFQKADSPLLVYCSYHTEYQVFEMNKAGEISTVLAQGQYANWNATFQSIYSFTTQKLQEGYEEIEANQEIFFDEHALNFDTLEFKSTSLIPDQELDFIIGKYQHLVSPPFRSFLKRFYKVDLVKKKYAFPSNENAYKKLHKFLYPDQINPTIKLKELEYLKIAQTKDSLFIVSDSLGKIYLIQRGNEANLLFANFSDFVNSIFEYDFIDEEEVYFAREGNLDFFKRYVEDNYVDNKFDSGYTPMYFALEHPALVEFLLEKGANPNKIRMPQIQDIEESIHLLKKYGYDPSIWINSRAERFESAFNNWKYKEIFSDLKPANYRIPVSIPLRKRRFLDKIKLQKIERLYGNTIPAELKHFILNHAGASLDGLWIKVDINNGCYLKMDRILSLEEIPKFIELHKSRNKANGFGKADRCLPIAKTSSYETIYLEEKKGTPYLGIDNQYETPHFLSTRIISTKENLIAGLLDSFYHEDQLFVFEAKAILDNDLESISLLLQKNWNPNHPLHPYGTPLGLALYLNNFAMVDLLLDGGAEIASVINDTDYFYGAKKPLEAAMTMCSLEMVKHLLSKGVLGFDPTCDYYELALKLIERSGRTHLVEVLPELKKVCT